MIPSRILILTGGVLLFAANVRTQPAPEPQPPTLPLAPVPPQPPQPAVPSDLGFDFSFGPGFQDQIAAQVRVQTEQARALADQIRVQPFFQRGSRRGGDGLYASGQRALDRSQWDEALGDFTRVASSGGSRADGALYWKAYTLNKLGRRDEALAAIAELRRSYANSRWLDDAKALEIEVQQAAGQQVSPESQTDEELKLMAVNALVRTDPDRAFPLLENLLKSAQPPRLKERALFVLAQTDAPRAQQLLEQVARGGGNPDLQIAAITYLGALARRKGNGQLLYEIYGSTSDVNVKRAALSALRTSGDMDRLLQAVNGERSPDLQAEGIRMLGSKSDTGDRLVAIYNSASDARVKRAVADSLSAQRNAKALVDLARKESDREMKIDLVRRISSMQSKEATDYMLELLK